MGFIRSKLGDKTWNSMWDKEEAEYKEWQKNSMWTWDRKNVNNKEKAETEKVIKEKEKESEEPGWFTSFMMGLAPLINNGKYGVNNLDEVEQKERENALRDREEPIVDTQEINDMASDAANYSDVIETIYQKNLYSN